MRAKSILQEVFLTLTFNEGIPEVSVNFCYTFKTVS